MGWRLWGIVVASSLVACGPVIAPGEDPDSSGSDGGEAETGTPQSTTVDVATGDSSAEPPPSTLSGDYLLALAFVIVPELPLQWRASVVHDLSDGSVTMALQPLALDQGATTTPRTPVGDPLFFTTNLDDNGYLYLDLGEVFIAGAANPITGSELRVALVIEGTAFDRELWCGAAYGMVTAPLDLDLTGSTFAFTPLVGGSLPGDPLVSTCP